MQGDGCRATRLSTERDDRTELPGAARTISVFDAGHADVTMDETDVSRLDKYGSWRIVRIDRPYRSEVQDVVIGVSARDYPPNARAIAACASLCIRRRCSSLRKLSA